MKRPFGIRRSSARGYLMMTTLAVYILLVVLDGLRSFALRPASAALWLMWLRMGFAAFTALLFLSVGALAWLYGRQRPVARLVFGFCCAMALVFVGETAADSSGGDFFFLLVSSLGAVAGIYLLALLLLLFPHNYLARKEQHGHGRFVWVYIVFQTLLLVIQTAKILLTWSVTLPLYEIIGNGASFAALCCALVSLLITYRLAREGRERQQMLLLVWGGTLAIAPFIFLSLLPGLFGLPGFDPQITTVTMGLFPLALAYAVLRYQMLVLDRSIHRAATWIVGTIMLVVVDFLGIVLLGVALTGTVYAICVAAMTMLLAGLLPRLAGRATENLFFTEFRPYRHLLNDTERMLQETSFDLERVADLLSLALIDALGSPSVALFIDTGIEQHARYTLVPELAPESLRHHARHELLQYLASCMGSPPAGTPNAWEQIQGDDLIVRLTAANRSLFASELRRAQQPAPSKGLAYFFNGGNSGTGAEPLLVAMRAQGKIIGLLALGAHDEAYAGPQLEIIRLVLAQFAPILDNCLLAAHALQMEALAATDPLTQLPNHRSLIERLEQEVARARRSGHPLSVLFFDGDHFKRVNDSYGHAVGDAVLREMAERARSGLRAGDVPGRYGGEEFVALLPEADAEEALVVAERLRAAMAGSPMVVELVEGGYHATVSVGVSTYPDDGASGHELIEIADQAMYWAKRLGRNQVRTPAEARRAMHNAALAATVSSLERREDPALDGLSPEQLLRADQAGLVYSLMRLLDLRDQGMSIHSYLVSDFSAAIAKELGLPEQTVVDVATAALLHDIGKIGVPDAILQQTGPLSQAEWSVIRQHPEQGAAILEDTPALSHLARAVRGHHERWDGTGYPNQIAGRAIPLDARIIAVAEAYHAMISERPHTVSRSESAAQTELERCAGTQFDPEVVAAFLAVLDRQRLEQTRAVDAATLPV
jgi:diguanylate cyclase (GGDEF)-like protein/putative nucleotidyltransferase with HDIG domain